MNVPRSFFGLFCLVALFLPTAFAHTAAPNVVIIFTDDQGYGDLGCYGAEGYETPNIDGMAAEGARFTDFYVPAPVCTPSRGALMTGCYPMRIDLGHRVLFPYSMRGLHPDEVTLAELLKGAGYATGMIGKWHLGHHTPFLPTRQGFDTFFGTPYSNDMNSHYYKRFDFLSPPLPLMRGERIVESNPDQSQLTRRCTEEAVAYIHAHKASPFFLYVAHNMPHVPIYASEKFAGSTSHGRYGDVIAEIDWSVGRILEALDGAGVAENTLVIFTSDNGPVTGQRKSPDGAGPYKSGSAGPLRGKKNTTWEGGMRVPAIARWPARIPSGTVVSELATSMDILPTVAKVVGASLPPAAIDGRDILPLLEGDPSISSPHEAFFYYRDNRLQALRSGRWKLHVYRPEWKGKLQRPLLYDLTVDVGESTDLASRHPDIVARLQGLAAVARTEFGDAVTGQSGAGVRRAAVFGSERSGDDGHRIASPIVN
jgi:arylsulfatase A